METRREFQHDERPGANVHLAGLAHHILLTPIQLLEFFFQELFSKKVAQVQYVVRLPFQRPRKTGLRWSKCELMFGIPTMRNEAFVSFS